MNKGTLGIPPGGQVRILDARLMTSFGPANVYQVIYPVPLDGLELGRVYSFIAHQANTGACVANLDGTGQIPIRQGDGTTDLAANMILLGQLVQLQWDGTRLQMVSPPKGLFSGVIGGAGGIWTQNAVGGDPGLDGFNAKKYQIDGVNVAPRDNLNMTLNPDSAVAQLGVSIAAVADNTYTGDGLRVLSEVNGDCNWARASTGGHILSTTRYADELAVVTNTNKFGAMRPFESQEMRSYKGQPVVFSCVLYADASLGNIKMGLMQWTGAADGISGDPISAWGADGVTPTLVANWTFLNTPANLAVTTTPTVFSVTGTVSTSATNLALLVWNDDKTTTVGHILAISNWDLRKGSIVMPFEAVEFQRNLTRCQRYCWKSFNQSIAPVGLAGRLGALSTQLVIAGAVASTIFVRNPVPMAYAPSFGIYNPDVNNSQLRNITKGTDATGTAASNSSEMGANIDFTGLAAWSAGDFVSVHLLASARI